MDRNFDDIAHRFEKNIYHSPKGELRLAIIWEDLESILPEAEQDKSWRILDAGAGMGQISARLAARGHQLVLCDISENMLELARKHIEDLGVSGHIEFRHTAVQNLTPEESGQYDLVVFHAVLEWVKDPWHTLADVVKLVKPGGYISLLFYNRHSMILRNVLRGNFRKVKSGQFRGDPGSLTPMNPLLPDEVYSKLEYLGIKILKSRGVRMFYDYLTKDLREQRSLEDILEMERMFSEVEPYRSMARYIHVMGKKTEG